MSVLLKILRHLAYPNYQYKGIGLTSTLRFTKWGRSFHFSSLLRIRLHMEHENLYAYNILQNKGYAINFNVHIPSQILTKEKFENLLEQDWSRKPPAAIFEAFAMFAVYCSDNNICISGTQFDSFIDYLTDSIKFATDIELKNIFYSLKKWPETKSIRIRNYIEVWVALDDECLKRIKNWAFDELLSFLCLFYMINVLPASDFAVKSLNRLATKAKQLTPGQLVQTLFFIGIWRKPPFDMHNLEIHLSENFSAFSVDDLAIMSMGFFKSKTPLRDMNLVLKIINTVIENSQNVHEVSLAALLKLIRYSSKMTCDERIQSLLETLQYEVPRLSIMCNVHLALLGTTTLNFHEGCLNKIAEKVNNHMCQTRLKDLERLVLTYGTFHFKPQTENSYFFTSVMDELRKPERNNEILKYGRSFACCLAYLSLLEIYPEDLINRALSNEFLENTYGKHCYSYGREILTLHYTAEIHCGDGVVNRLSEKTAKLLAKKYTDYIPSEDFKKQYNVTERMVLEITRLLKESRGGPNYVIGDHILPYHQRGDIIVCDDKFGNPVDVKNMFPSADFGLLRRPCKEFNMTVLVIAGKNALIHGTDTATGPLISKIRDLKALGYNAALVPWSLFSKLETAHEKITFLNDIIRNCQSISK